MKKKNYLTIEVNKLIKDNWTEEEKANAKLVLDFFQRLMNEHDFEYTLNKHGKSVYQQHNRAIPNGIPGLIFYVKTLTKRFPDYAFDVKNVIADGDMIVLHSHTTMKAAHRGDETKGFIITDHFRLRDGQLAEHWDSIQPIDLFSRMIILTTGGSVQNNNPIF